MLRTSSYLADGAYIRDAGRDPLMSSATQAPRSDRLRADRTGVGRVAEVGRMPSASSYLAEFAYLGDPGAGLRWSSAWAAARTAAG